MSFPHGAVGWSALCDSGISWSYSLFDRGSSIPEFNFCFFYVARSTIICLFLVVVTEHCGGKTLEDRPAMGVVLC